MWLQISSGRGPVECEYAVGQFLKILESELRQDGVKFEVLDFEIGEKKDLFKSILLNINEFDKDGEKIEDVILNRIRDNEGSVLFTFKSHFRPNHKRKNWFISVEIFNESEKIKLNLEEIKFETFRNGGPGGQNVNKLDTAVRATHIKTGIVVVSREERSQHQNKRLALAKIEKMIEQLNDNEISNKKDQIWSQHNNLERGNPKRKFNL